MPQAKAKCTSCPYVCYKNMACLCMLQLLCSSALLGARPAAFTRKGPGKFPHYPLQHADSFLLKFRRGSFRDHLFFVVLRLFHARQTSWLRLFGSKSLVLWFPHCQIQSVPKRQNCLYRWQITITKFTSDSLSKRSQNSTDHVVRWPLIRPPLAACQLFC